MFYDFDTHVVDAFRSDIFGHLIPTNTVGSYVLALTILPLLALYFLQRRMSDKQTNGFIFSTAAVALLGTYIASCRWLDDLNVNLIHPFNLLHHRRFSVSALHMVNGTVELVYYALLTPFAWSRASLLIATYVAGFVIAILHLLIAEKMVRQLEAVPRLLVLIGFSVTFPLIQSFSSGYGNGLVSLAVFWGFYNLTINRTGWTYLCAALLPALRPDAAIYSVSLVFADLLMYRKIRPLFWLLTPIPAVCYLATVKLMYGFFIPTPMLLKQVTLRDLTHVMPKMPLSLWRSITRDIFNALLVIGTLLFFFLRPSKSPIIAKSTAAIWLVSMFPVLFFFRAAGMFGYNPTLTRYYVGWQTALTVVGLAGFVATLELGMRKWEAKRHRENLPNELQPDRRWSARSAITASTCMLVLSIGVYLDLRSRDDGAALGIELNSNDVNRFPLLIYASHYVDSILPKHWRIASTEMDTFGLYNGREIVDLWGFSNRDIASSKRIAANPRLSIKIRPTELLESRPEVFWVRTVEADAPNNSIMWNDDPIYLPKGFVHFPNFNRALDQIGNPLRVLAKYSIVRIFHDKEFTTMLLVRNDVMPRLLKSLTDHAHTLRTSGPLNMHALKAECRHWPE